MPLIHQAITQLSQAPQFLDNPKFHIHEIHHTAKKDGPSGTALLWKEWLQQPATLSFSRKDDVKGIHTLTIKTTTEEITLKHEAFDRSIFARGALWTAQQLFNGNFKEPGFHSFINVVEHHFKRNDS